MMGCVKKYAKDQNCDYIWGPRSHFYWVISISTSYSSIFPSFSVMDMH